MFVFVLAWKITIHWRTQNNTNPLSYSSVARSLMQVSQRKNPGATRVAFFSRSSERESRWPIFPGSCLHSSIFKARHSGSEPPQSTSLWPCLWPSISPFKKPCDYIGPIQIIQNNFPIKDYLISNLILFGILIPLCHLTWHLHKFWGWRLGYPWGPLFCSL